jgi:queuine tRNA-ribosyltransferase
MSLSFEVLATDGQARCGRLVTPHGEVETPAFMPVATLGAVKGITPDELASAGASMMLSNLYHLALRPGVEVISRLGGLHAFTGWKRALLTDSGGYQVFSLATLRTVDDEGVTFRSHLDGGQLRFTPESVVEMQRRLGVDVAVALDECPAWPVSFEEASVAAKRTLEWACKARHAWREGRGGLFGVVQGSVYPQLRERAAADLARLDFDGYTIGGVSVGEPIEQSRAVVEWTAPRLPPAKPRYLMGLGLPQDMIHAVSHGVDLFDCVLPARNGRHGVLFTRQGILKLKNARFRDDGRPPDPSCQCPTCRQVSRAFLHHLLRAGEITGAVLATAHNLRFYLDFMADLREAIYGGTLSEVAASLARKCAEAGPPTETAAGSQSAAS